jgi:hypothetical protein
MIKRLAIVWVYLLLNVMPALAAEGMWLPMLLNALNEEDMQAKGMKLSAEDIYSVNRSSLKDAIVSFGGFCTGELISEQGLLLTNHHCGYGQLQRHSSVSNDLLTEGFWAMNRQEELPNPGLFVTFLVRMEDVTREVLQGLDADMEEEQRERLIAERMGRISRQAIEGTHYQAIIKPFFYGNEYYMFITERYDDVRLVGAPPSSIGKFGGDTDNWMWPRHTGDFSLFRVYAGPDGRPAPYSENNVPLKPKHHLPVSLAGVQEGDFTMVFGFPGRTEQYLTSHAVKMLVEETNPNRIALREKRLAIMDSYMKANDTVRIQYAGKYASIANYWKKWIGENRGLKEFNALHDKQELEADFTNWVQKSPERKVKYGNLLNRFADLYGQQQTVNLANVYRGEGIFGAEIMRLAASFAPLLKGERTEEEIAASRPALVAAVNRHFQDYDKTLDKSLLATVLEMYRQYTRENPFHPKSLQKLGNSPQAYQEFADKAFAESALASRERMLEMLHNYDPRKTAKAFRKDPAFQLFTEFDAIYRQHIAPVYQSTQAELEKLYRLYVAGLREMQQDKHFWPDANSTMRVAYGVVDGYVPYDGVYYRYYTTLDGIMEKENPASDEFVVPERLKEIYRKQDYGRYAEEDYMPVCFIASNHTTGGNSGSPVIDAEGRLIGLNFDRTWESTMSDIKYDAEICRNIAVDIRYILLIIDKFAGAGYLVEEMSLVDVEEAMEEAVAE